MWSIRILWLGESVSQAFVPVRIRRNFPDAIFVRLLARLAGEISLQKQGLGHAFARDRATQQTGHSDGWNMVHAGSCPK